MDSEREIHHGTGAWSLVPARHQLGKLFAGLRTRQPLPTVLQPRCNYHRVSEPKHGCQTRVPPCAPQCLQFQCPYNLCFYFHGLVSLRGFPHARLPPSLPFTALFKIIFQRSRSRSPSSHNYPAAVFPRWGTRFIQLILNHYLAR